MNIAKKALALLAEGTCFAEATILESSGSTPRGAGTSMLILPDGSIFGTVGGGGLEGTVRRAGADVLTSKAPQTIQFKLDGTDAAAAGSICGGRAKVQVEYVDAADPESSARYTARLGETGDGTVYVFGAGHCGEKLCHVLAPLGFRIVMIDDRSEFANPGRCPEADEILVPPSMIAPFDSISFDHSSYIVIVTRGHTHDEAVLRRSLHTDAGYIGMIGSTPKRNGIYANLRKEGYTDGDIARVYSPIGVAIGAETPEEIAISIAAELIRVRAEKRGQ